MVKKLLIATAICFSVAGTAVASEKTLYDKLGGEPAVTAVLASSPTSAYGCR